RYSIERHAPVIADNASTTVGIGQTSQNVRAAALPDVRCVRIEDGVIVSLAVLAECFDPVRIGLVAICLESIYHHPLPALRHDCPLERCFCLKPDNDFVLAIDIARSIGSD